MRIFTELLQKVLRCTNFCVLKIATYVKRENRRYETIFRVTNIFIFFFRR